MSLVPRDQVVSDMCEDGIVASAARDYYISNYATPEEIVLMEKEDKCQLIFAFCIIGTVVLSLVAVVLRAIIGT